MILKSLRFTNVKCYEQERIEFIPGKNVIIGKNGSGKTTILQSILYSLISQYPEGTNDQLVRSGEDTARFKLEFEQNGIEYLVARKLRTNGSNEASLTDRTRNALIADTQSKVTQEIQEIAQIKKEVFQDVIVVRQGEIAKIIDMQSQKRKNLFDKLLGIHDYELANERCGRIQRILEGKASQIEELIRGQKGIADKLLGRKKDLDHLKAKLKLNKEELRNLKKKLISLEQEKRKFEKLEEKLRKLSANVERGEEFLEKQKKQAQEYKKTISKLCNNVSIATPKQYTVNELSSLEKKASSNLEGIEQDLITSRTQQKDLIEKKSALEGHRENSAEHQADIDELSLLIDNETSYVIRNLPEVKTKPKEQWPQRIKERMKSAKKQRIEIRRLLRNATRLQERVRITAPLLRDLREQETNLAGRISDNNRQAEEVGAAEWRERAQENADRLQKELDKIIELERIAKEQYQEQLGEVGKSEKKVEDLEEDLTELSSLIGKRCPKCKQIVDEKHAKALSNGIRKDIQIAEEALILLKKKTEEVEHQVIKLDEDRTELRNRIELVIGLQVFFQTEKQLKSDLNGIEGKIRNKTEAFRQVKSDLSQLRINALKTEESKTEKWIDILNEIKLKTKTIRKSIHNLEKLEKKLDILNKRTSELQEEYSSKSLERLDQRISSLEERKSSLNTLIEKLSALTGLSLNLDDIEELLDKEKQEIGHLVERYNPTEHKTVSDNLKSTRNIEVSLQTETRISSKDRIPKAAESFGESKKASESIKEFKLEHQKVTDALAVLHKLREFYREIQRPLRRRDIIRAANHASQIFKLLVSSNEFGRILITEDHDLFVSRFDKLEPLSMLSGGEQILACLAIRLGFAGALATSDLVMLDEPTAFLDDQRKTELIDTLYRVNLAKQMLIVTHDDEFEKVADRIIHVEKDASSHLSKVRW